MPWWSAAARYARRRVRSWGIVRRRSARVGREARAQRTRPLGEQAFTSNSLVAFGDRLVMKLYRVLEDGPNPDLELGRLVGRQGLACVPAVLGAVELRRGSHATATLAMVQAYVPNEGDLWSATRDAVDAFLHDTEAEAEAPQLDASGHGFLLRLAQQEPSPAPYDSWAPRWLSPRPSGAALPSCTARWLLRTLATLAWRQRP